MYFILFYAFIYIESSQNFFNISFFLILSNIVVERILKDIDDRPVHPQTFKPRCTLYSKEKKLFINQNFFESPIARLSLSEGNPMVGLIFI